MIIEKVIPESGKEHSADDFKALMGKAKAVFDILLEKLRPTFQSERIQECIDYIAQQRGYDREIYTHLLHKALKPLGITKKKPELKIHEAFREQCEREIPVLRDAIIAHPSYEVNHEFVSLGFRETIVKGDRPEEANFYIISAKTGLSLQETKSFKLDGKTVIFDERDRLLLFAKDRWSRARIQDFINNPTTLNGIYQKVKQILKHYIEVQNEAAYGLVSSWIIATYFHRMFNSFPYLFFYGKKGSGKSRSPDLLERMAFHAAKIKGISVAALADTIDGVRGTFLNDQAEALSDVRNIELLGIHADSYTPGGGKRRVVSLENKKRKILEFEPYGPKAYASNRDIHWDLKDRCIEIVMVRAAKDHPYPEPYLPCWQDLRDQLHRLLLTKWQDVQAIYPTTGSGVMHRVKELWRPLETILKLEKVPE